MMKVNKTFFYLTMVVALMLSSIGCSRDDETKITVESIGEVDLLRGTVHYNDVLQCWFITYYEEGSIDSFIDYYPYQLKDEYKTDGMQVVFSGLVYESNFDVPQIGGAQYYRIDLIYIETSHSEDSGEIAICHADSLLGYWLSNDCDVNDMMHQNGLLFKVDGTFYKWYVTPEDWEETKCGTWEDTDEGVITHLYITDNSFMIKSCANGNLVMEWLNFWGGERTRYSYQKMRLGPIYIN
jgi:hypothetical protein